MTTTPTPDPVDALLARLEALEAQMRVFSDVSRIPEIKWYDAGHAGGLHQARILAVHELRGAEARDAYIAATEEAKPTTPVAPAPTGLRRLLDAVLHRGPGYDPVDADTELARLRAELSRLQEAGDHHIGAAEEERDEARMWARHGYEIGQRSCTWSDFGVAPAWLTEGWPPHSTPTADETPTAVGDEDRAYWSDKDADGDPS